MAGNQPGNDLTDAYVQEMWALPVPVEIFRLVVALENHNLCRILHLAIKVIGNVARFPAG